MSVTVDSETALVRVPSRLKSLFEGDELPRWALEAILVEANRQHRCSSGFLRHLLGLEIGEADALLASKGIFLDYTIEEIQQDAQVIASRR